MDRLVQHLVGQASWLVDHSHLRSLQELVGWISPLLTDEAASRLERLMPLEHPVQEQGEEAIAEFLTQGERVDRRGESHAKVVRPSRSVDWGETYARAVWDPPLTFVEQRRSSEVDVEVMAALVGQAEQWLRALRRADYNVDRRERLKEALARVPAAWKRRSAVLDRRKIERLRRVDAERAQRILEALHLWSGATDDESDREAFQKALEDALDREEHASSNDNHLLEVLVLWSVARVAVEGAEDGTEEGTEWGFADEVLSYSEGEHTTRHLDLRRDDGLRCRVGMTKPSRLLGGRRAGGETLDRTVALRRAHGLGGDGYQPDLTLRFWHDDCDGEVFAFADAKNYEKSDLAGPIKSTATAYLYAYARLCGRPLERRSPFELETAVRPAMTLFVRQSLDRVAGLETAEEERLGKRLRDAPEKLPSILLLGSDLYLGEFGELESDEDAESEEAETEETSRLADCGWRAPVLAAWFRRLAGDTAKALKDGRGVELEGPLYSAESARPTE